jgi:hypothetical protein
MDFCSANSIFFGNSRKDSLGEFLVEKVNRLYMKILGIMMTVALLWSCAAPRHQYVFDHYDYNSGRKKILVTERSDENSQDNPFRLHPERLVASAADEPIVSPTVALPHMSPIDEAMPASDKRTLKKSLRKEIRETIKDLRSHDAGERISETKELDQDLKLSIIFGAIGFTLVVLGGLNTIFWVLGIVGLVVGLVFFIKWIQTQ